MLVWKTLREGQKKSHRLVGGGYSWVAIVGVGGEEVVSWVFWEGGVCEEERCVQQEGRVTRMRSRRGVV